MINKQKYNISKIDKYHHKNLEVLNWLWAKLPKLSFVNALNLLLKLFISDTFVFVDLLALVSDTSPLSYSSPISSW